MMLSPPLKGRQEKAEVTARLGPHGGLGTKPGGERLVVRNSHRLRISEGLGKRTSRWSNGEPVTSFFSSKSISQLAHLCSRFPSLALLCSPAEGDPRAARHATVNSSWWWETRGRDQAATSQPTHTHWQGSPPQGLP